MAQAVGRWSPLLKSLAVHALLLALLGSGLWMVRREPPAQQVLAIEATVVDARDVGLGKPVRTPPRPAPVPEPVPDPVPQTPPPQADPEPPAPPPKPDPEIAAKAARERELVAQRADAERRRVAEEKERTEQAARDKARKEAERKQAERKEAERKEAERKEAERKEAERKEAERKLAEQRAAELKREEAEKRQRSERESELQRQLAAEEKAMAARAGGLGVQWAAAIQARIQRAWIRPPSARTGLDCTVAVTQVPGGEVVAVRVLSCNGDETVRQSIEAAVYRASPLPPPPDPSLFERNLEVRFKPND